MTAILWTAKSVNAKTGPMPVSTTTKTSCPSACPFKGNGCYAESGPLGFVWSSMTAAGPNASFKNGRSTTKTVDWQTLCANVSNLPADTLWRHNQAGDLPQNNGTIDRDMVDALVQANAGKRGFTYTHHDTRISENVDAIRSCNANGFTVNLSGNDLNHVDELLALNAGPVVCVLPDTVQGKTDIRTPNGAKVIVCPATYRDDVSCKSCGLCQIATRNVVVGFPAHGARKRAASSIATGSAA